MLLSKIICFNGCLWIKELQFQAGNVKWSQQTFQIYIPPGTYVAGPHCMVHYLSRQAKKAGLYRMGGIGDMPLGFVRLFHCISCCCISQILNWETMIQHCKEKKISSFSLKQYILYACTSDWAPCRGRSPFIIIIVNYTTGAEINVCKYAVLINLLKLRTSLNTMDISITLEDTEDMHIFSFAAWSQTKVTSASEKPLKFKKQDKTVYTVWL